MEQLHLYHEVDNNHHIAVADGTSKTMGEYINKWRLAHFQNVFFQELSDNKIPIIMLMNGMMNQEM
jgi:hypothetical protein